MKKNACSKATYCDYDGSCVPHDEWGYKFGTCVSDPFDIACDVQGTQESCENEPGCTWNKYYEEPEPTKAPTEAVVVPCSEVPDEATCNQRFLSCKWFVEGPDAYCGDLQNLCAEEEYQKCPNYGKQLCEDLYGECCQWTSNKKGCESNKPAPPPETGGECFQAILKKDKNILDTFQESDFANCDCGKGDKKMCKKLKDPEACAANACCKLQGSKCKQRGKIKASKDKDPCAKKCKKLSSEKKCTKCNLCAWDGAVCSDNPNIDG